MEDRMSASLRFIVVAALTVSPPAIWSRGGGGQGAGGGTIYNGQEAAQGEAIAKPANSSSGPQAPTSGRTSAPATSNPPGNGPLRGQQRC